MKKFTEDDWYRIREGAFSIPEPSPERRRREQRSARDERAQRRSEGQQVERTEGLRRSSRHQREAATNKGSAPEGSSSDNPSSEDSQDAFVASSESEDFSPPPRGSKRKRVVAFKAPKEKVVKSTTRRIRRVLSDSDDEMAEAAVSRSRSVTPVPPIKKHSKRLTTLADSDDEMAEPSVSRSRSVTPAPAVKRRKVEGKRRVTLADSDDDME